MASVLDFFDNEAEEAEEFPPLAGDEKKASSVLPVLDAESKRKLRESIVSISANASNTAKQQVGSKIENRGYSVDKGGENELIAKIQSAERVILFYFILFYLFVYLLILFFYL